MVEIEKLMKYSREYLVAKERYERAVRINVRTSQPLEDKSIFWKMLEDFTSVLRTHLPKRTDCLPHAADLFMRGIWVQGGEGYTFGDIPAFLKTYAKLKSKLKSKLSEPLRGWGDGLGFLIDALPLVGKDVCVNIIMGGVKDAESLGTLVRDNCDEPRISTLILDGENHVEQTLEDAYIARLCYVLLEEDKEFALELENADP